MNKNTIVTVLLLELRKQRRTFLSVWLVLALSVLVVAAIVPRMTEAETMRIVRLMMTLVLSSGVPLLAAMYAAAPAAALRREPDSGIERSLPVAPRIRVFAALVAAAFYFELTRWLVILISALCLAEDSAGALLSSIVAGSASLAWAVLMLETLLIAFTASYWLRLPMVGGAIALLAAGFQTFFAIFADIRGQWIPWLEGAGAYAMSGMGVIQFVTVYGPAAGRFLNLVSVLTWLGIAAALLEVVVLAPRLEREQPSGGRAFLILAGVVAGSLLFCFLLAARSLTY